MLTSLTNRVNTLLLVLLVLMAAAIIGILANRASAGPLDPPGPPASTMHTLGDTPPSWDQVLNSTNGAPGPLNPPAGCNSDRFKCVMTYAQCSGVCITVYPAVLDEETGLVWQRAPSTTKTDYYSAKAFCEKAGTGRRNGWRLPTEAELETLRDPTLTVDPALPSGNPFSVPAGEVFWTSTWEFVQSANPSLTPTIWRVAVDAFSTSIYGYETPGVTTNTYNYWCVRGGTDDQF